MLKHIARVVALSSPHPHPLRRPPKGELSESSQQPHNNKIKIGKSPSPRNIFVSLKKLVFYNMRHFSILLLQLFYFIFEEGCKIWKKIVISNKYCKNLCPIKRCWPISLLFLMCFPTLPELK